MTTARPRSVPSSTTASWTDLQWVITVLTWIAVVWLVAGVAGDPDLWAAVRFAGREMSLIGFVNLIWSAVFIIVAALSVWSVLKAALRRFRGPLMTAHA